MVGIGGQIAPFVGNSAVQLVSGNVNLTAGTRISGHGATGVGGAVVSGNICHSEAGFLEFAFSGQKIWIPYWVSA